MNTNSLAIVGGGIAGLACALATARGGSRAIVLEQTAVFGEVGAGIQLGPNAVRRLQSWGVLNPKTLHPSEPEALHIHSAVDGSLLGKLRLRGRARAHYGAPYFTVHRADLHNTLIQAALTSPRIQVVAGTDVRACESSGHVSWSDASGECDQRFDAVVNAQGIWSKVRTDGLGGKPPQWTGHVAYRALVPMAALPLVQRRLEIGVWLGPNMHVVHYPVRGNDLLNVVLLVEAPKREPAQDWSQTCDRSEVDQWVNRMHPSLRSLFDAVAEAGADWRLWALAGRPPISDAESLYSDRLVHVGDAAHPMLPYLAQGAAMGIEDADVLAMVLARYPHNVQFALREYARLRWERVRRVQARARRNGKIFHASGVMALARNWAMALGKEQAIDLPWLYNY